MRPENGLEYTNTHETAEGHPPAASVSKIMNRETPTGKLWPFLGGIVIGAAGVITTALVTDALTYGSGGTNKQPEDEKELLALQEGSE